MAELFARVSILIAAAFALGLAVGWAFWRFQRRSLPVSEWRALRAELADLQGQLEAAAAARSAMADALGGSRQELVRLTELVTASWNERNELRRRVADLDAVLARSTAELTQTAALAEHLQRRVVELNSLAAQALDVEHRPLARPSPQRGGPNGTFPPLVPPPGSDVTLRR
jgi:septal ring factor EnvC (AmiA/AmiB activator)